LAFWLHGFSSTDKIHGEAYIQNLFQEKPDVALRIMIQGTLSAGSGRLLAGWFALGFNKPIWNTAASI